MQPLLEALLFGVAVAFMLIGMLGIILPVLPGIIMIWLIALGYAIIEGFEAIDWITFGVITLIALTAMTAEFWMSSLGAKKGGASRRALLLGIIGGFLGFLILTPLFPIAGSLFGGIAGYAAGTLVGQYHKYRDWDIALKASIGGIAGWGASVVIQIIAGLLIMSIFIWQVLSFHA